MVTHFYDSSPDSVEIQITRLRPARAITDSHIPCVVWAEDALAFAHFVPTVLFALQLLVPDEHLLSASSAITSQLPYVRMEHPPDDWLEHKFIDSSRPTCFPHSIHLKSVKSTTRQSDDDPEDIYIHPQSFFSVNARNHDLSKSLVPPLPSSHADIRFLTRTAFLDSLIDTLLDPPIGFRHWKLTQRMKVYTGYLLIYTLREYPCILPSGELEPEHEVVRKSLKVENQQYFDRRIRRTSKGWITDVQDRRAFLERAGRITAQSRPLPRNTPTRSVRQVHLQAHQTGGRRLDIFPRPPMPRAHTGLSLFAGKMLRAIRQLVWI